MASPPPLWRRLYDTAERAVAPRLETLVRTKYFARGTAMATRAQVAARAQAAGLSARAWHLMNLPTGADIARLRVQIGALDREVRRLALRLEQEQEQAHAGERPEGKEPDAADTRPP